MRQPPPVSVRCAGGAAWRWAVSLLQALAAAALSAWFLALLLGSGLSAQGLAALGAAALVFAATTPWRPRPPVSLVWDGQVWQRDGEPGALQVTLDLGPWMLLRLRPVQAGGRPWRRWRWVAVSAAEAGTAWHALRVAAHAGGAGGAGLAATPHV